MLRVDPRIFAGGLLGALVLGVAVGYLLGGLV
jgi:cytochrome bd-type quinol oxidase subunit 2